MLCFWYLYYIYYNCRTVSNCLVFVSSNIEKLTVARMIKPQIKCTSVLFKVGKIIKQVNFLLAEYASSFSLYIDEIKIYGGSPCSK